MNMRQMLQMMQSKDPKQTAVNMLKQVNTPMAQNAAQMLESDNREGLRQLAQNLCRAKGTTLDAEVQRMQAQFGIR